MYLDIQFDESELNEIMGEMEKAEEKIFECYHRLKRLKKIAVKPDNTKALTESETMEAVAVVSETLKAVLTDRYSFHPVLLPHKPEDDAFYKDMAVRGLRTALEVLTGNRNLEESLKHALILYESDLERFGYASAANAAKEGD